MIAVIKRNYFCVTLILIVTTITIFESCMFAKGDYPIKPMTRESFNDILINDTLNPENF